MDGSEKKIAKKNKPVMKGWVGKFKGEEWCMLVHGETAAKAKNNFHRWEPSGYGEYVIIRVHRIPGLDDKPITRENARNAGFSYYDESRVTLDDIHFVNDCRCKICRDYENN